VASPPVEASAAALAEAVALELAPSAATAAAQLRHLRRADFWGKVRVAVLPPWPPPTSRLPRQRVVRPHPAPT